MEQKTKDKTLTLTAEELEKIIKSSIKEAMRELKEEETLPCNDTDELQAAPATFSLISLISTLVLAVFTALSIIAIILCVKITMEIGINFYIILYGIAFFVIGALSVLSIHEINKTKKIEVVNIVFSAIMTFSTLIVAVVSAIIAYKAL